jgi:arsenical pump membrane protein
VGVVITVFLSNDATAVVLTPAVFAATRKAKVEPLPFLFICAFIANAASFVLPISNPANLVLYGAHVPPLRDWLARFAAPSVISILATYAALRFMERGSLGGTCNRGLPQEKFTPGSWIALSGISATAIVLLTVSAMGMPLGLPTAIMGFLTALAVLVSQRTSPWTIAKGVSWSILPLVAGLFILVEGLNRTGVVALLAHLIQSAGYSLAPTAAAGTIIALGSNVINNLPAGLIARSVLQTAHATRALTDSILIGVDLGPNLSVTGSLATILWLSVIRREGEDVSFGRFFKAGLVVMPPALILALAFRLI